MPQITSLDLRGNGIREAGLVALAGFIRSNNTLHTLCLEWNSAGLFDRGMDALVDALESNNRVATLDLRNNKIGPEGGSAIGRMLGHNLSLTSLGALHVGVWGRDYASMTSGHPGVCLQTCDGIQLVRLALRAWRTAVRCAVHVDMLTVPRLRVSYLLHWLVGGSVTKHRAHQAPLERQWRVREHTQDYW